MISSLAIEIACSSNPRSRNRRTRDSLPIAMKLGHFHLVDEVNPRVSSKRKNFTHTQLVRICEQSVLIFLILSVVCEILPIAKKRKWFRERRDICCSYKNKNFFNFTEINRSKTVCVQIGTDHFLQYKLFQEMYRITKIARSSPMILL